MTKTGLLVGYVLCVLRLGVMVLLSLTQLKNDLFVGIS